MKKIISKTLIWVGLITGALACHTALAQPCTYLAYDGFNYNANVSLNALSGGTGWAGVWNVQNETTTIPGYQINNGSGSLSYGALQTLGRYATGGISYLSAGRRLATNEGGVFASYIAQYENGIGTLAEGDTLWVSFMLRKDGNNSQPLWLDLHDDGNVPWCTDCASQHLAVGYFGSSSDVGGQRRWTLRVNNNYYPTSVTVTQGAVAFMVLRLIFNNGNTNVSLYVNPSTLGNNIPAAPTVSQSTGTNNIIRSAGVYLGDNAANGAIDELRLARSYACVAPDNTISINLPPTAVITASTVEGQVPLAINFNGGSSTDPEGQALTYTWNFGDGSPIVTGSSVSHTYNTVGLLTVSLTVSDNLGLQHTAYQTLTLLNENGTYPCQTSFTVQNMPSCNNNNGRITINTANSTSFSLLRVETNTIMPVINGNEYHNLAAGIYNFTSNSGGSGCTDNFQLHLQVDSTTCVGWQPSNCAMEIGTNMSGFADWNVERPMKNLMKHVRPEPIPFTTTCFCWHVPDILDDMSFDENGYPTHIPQTTPAGNNTVIRYVISSESETGTNLQMGQQYVLLYDGVGTLQVNGGVNVTSNTAGRIQFSLAANNNIFIEILASTLGNHIRNIRILRLADEFADLNANPFYQGFLDKIAPFSSLRFMDWGATNNNPVSNWANRSSMSYFTYATSNGVPYETMIQLANQTQKDIWICVPHAADNNYITQMATLFRNNLNPNLTIYLEYSNEVWNWIFDQAAYNVDNSPSNLSYGRAYAEKAKNAFRIWHNVFGSESSRVKRVLGLQTTFSYLNEQILSQLSQNDWDYAAPTHYFGLDHDATGSPVLHAGSTPQDMINNSLAVWNSTKSAIKQDYNQIKLFGKKIITYEGGQHFVGNSFGIPYDYQQAMWDAQYTSGIYDLYSEVLDSIRAWGCQMAMNFSLASPQESVYGSWGVLNDIDIQPPYMTTAPKYQALLDQIPNRPNPIIVGSNNTCINSEQTYSVNFVAGHTYAWTVTGGVILNGQGTNTITVLWNSGITGTVTVEEEAP